MEEWKTYKIGEISEVNKSQYSPKENWQNFLYLDTGSITRNQIDSIQTISLATELPSRARRKVVNFDIVYSTVRPNQCHYGILKNPKTNLLVSTGFAVITVNQEVANPLFVYYYLTQDYIIDALQAIAEQSVSAYPSIKPSDIENVEVYLPPLNIQNTIANILSSLDSKIELNNRINHNLEQQAQALFSHWLNNCEDKVAISELCDNILDYTPITAKRVVALNSSDVTEGVFAELSYTPISEIKGQFKKRFEKGDILYSEIRPRNLHYAYCYFNPMDYIASTRLMVIRSKSEKLYSSVMLYQYLQMPKVFEEFTSKTESRSGTFPQGNFKDLSSSIVPYSGDNEEISIILESLYKLIWKNIDENKSLSSLRDSLLPILMSGELKINDLTC